MRKFCIKFGPFVQDFSRTEKPLLIGIIIVKGFTNAMSSTSGLIFKFIQGHFFFERGRFCIEFRPFVQDFSRTEKPLPIGIIIVKGYLNP